MFAIGTEQHILVEMITKYIFNYLTIIKNAALNTISNDTRIFTRYKIKAQG